MSLSIGNTVTLTASTTPTSAPLPGTDDKALVLNTGTSLAFVNFGATATAANGFPVAPGNSVLLVIGGAVTSVSAVLPTGATGSAAIYVTRARADDTTAN